MQIDAPLHVWWSSLPPSRRVQVVDSVDHDDMARGHVYAELRTLRLIEPLTPSQTAPGVWRNPIPWPDELADAINQFAQRWLTPEPLTVLHELNRQTRSLPPPDR